jgi:fructan beta-fructosidase
MILKKRFWASILVFAMVVYTSTNAQSINKEKYRPQFHFTPLAKWMNDPNGLVYFDGVYHLFYQYYPDSTIWGPMHWGHAMSKDLVHWERLPIALYPDSMGYIFSGSAVMDLKNTSGFGSKANPAMIAIFTYHNPKIEKTSGNEFEYQGLAYSLDKGVSWKKYDKNPIVKNPGVKDFRDPKVSWNQSAGKWIMVLAAGDKVKFFSSPNLLEWTFESDFGTGVGAHGGVWECPDIFPLHVEGTNLLKWVLLVNINPGGPNGGSATQYFVGDFDGHQFKALVKNNQWVDYGKDEYAGVTWSNVPNQDGRTLFIGWMSNWQYATHVPTQTWRSAMTFPRELKLLKENDGFVLSSQPVKEITSIRNKMVQVKINKVNGEFDISNQLTFDKCQLEMALTFQIPKLPVKDVVKKFGIKLSNNQKEEILIGYDIQNKQLYVDRTKSGISDFSKDFSGVYTAPCALKENKLEMHLLIDKASLELFTQEGRVEMTNIFFPLESYNKISVFTDHGEVQLNNFTVWSLNSIW